MDQDLQYWISRKVKISKEYNELRELKKAKLDELELQRQIKLENTRKIQELKQKIAEIADEPIGLNQPRALFKTKDSLLNVSAPLISTSKKAFYRQRTKEYEYFPVDNEETKSEDLNNKLFEHFLIIRKSSNNIEPEISFSLPKEDSFINSAQGRVVGNFAFPMGISSRRVKMSKAIGEVRQLLNTKVERNGKHFVFSLKSEGENQQLRNTDRANYKMELLYCCCVVIEEPTDIIDGECVFQSVCYCLISYFPYFELQFKILFHAINSKIAAEKALWVNQKDRYSYEQALQKIILESYLNCATDIISTCVNMYIKNKKVSINEIQYTLPNQDSELDTSYFCPLLFSLLSLNDLLYILFSILQEASVIFISKNMDYLSSCVLGFQALIRPFSWPHLITPILPSSLFDILEAPVPLLAGIPKAPSHSRSEVSDMPRPPEIPMRKLLHLITVDLDVKEVSQRVKKPLVPSVNLHTPRIYQGNLVPNYQKFNSGPCYHPNSDQLHSCKNIVDEIKIYMRRLLANLTVIQKEVDKHNVHDYDSIIDLLREQGGEDLPFKNNFYNTQMCTNYVEEYYSLRSSVTGRSFELC